MRLAREAILQAYETTLEAGLAYERRAFTAAAGMEYHVGSLRFQALYDLERYDFPIREAVRRLEQLAQLTVRCRMRLRAR